MGYNRPTFKKEKAEVRMSQEQNVGQLDSIISITLGTLALAEVIYAFIDKSFLLWMALIPIAVLVPFFLKRG